MSEPEAGAGRLRDVMAAWVERDGFRHYAASVAVEVGVGWAELVHDAEVAQRLLDFVRVPDGHPPRAAGTSTHGSPRSCCG